MGIVNKISREVDLEKKNNPGDHPSKLSAQDKQSIIHQITSGKLNNAVKVTVKLQDYPILSGRKSCRVEIWIGKDEVHVRYL